MFSESELSQWRRDSVMLRSSYFVIGVSGYILGVAYFLKFYLLLCGRVSYYSTS